MLVPTYGFVASAWASVAGYAVIMTKIGQIFRDTQCTEKAPQPFIRYTCYLYSILSPALDIPLASVVISV